MSAVVLTTAQRSALRGLAHGLPVTVHVGQGGVTPAVQKEVDIALNVHGLLKVRVLVAGREEREQMLATLADALFCAPVQHIGRVLVLWRARPEDAVPLQAARANPHPSRGPAPKEPGGGRRPAGGASRRTAAEPAGQPAVRARRARPEAEDAPGAGGRRARSGAEHSPSAPTRRPRPGSADTTPTAGRRPRPTFEEAPSAPPRRQTNRGPRPADRDGFIAERPQEPDRAARRPRAETGAGRGFDRDDAASRPAARRSGPPGARPEAPRPRSGAGSRSGPGSGPRSGPVSGPRSGPGSGPRSGPGSGPRSAPGSFPRSATSLRSAPGAGSRSAAGTRSGPGGPARAGSGPRSGPDGPRSGPAGGGPRSGPGGGRPRPRKPGRD